MQFLIFPGTLIILHILRPHSPLVSSTVRKIHIAKKYLAVSTAFLNSLSNPPYSAPALSYNSAHPALAISRLTSLLNTPHLHTLTEQTTRSYLSLAKSFTRTLRPRI